jgi:hypothetical protein
MLFNTHYGALEELKTNKPRFCISLMEKLMNGRMPVLSFVSGCSSSSRCMDKRDLDFVQNDPQYKDKTALVFTTDHGRGDKVKAEWTSHGNKFEGSSAIWFAAMGPKK